jgi:hypothetical protein
MATKLEDWGLLCSTRDLLRVLHERKG